jgi:hypothetical protein
MQPADNEPIARLMTLKVMSSVFETFSNPDQPRIY